MKLFELHLQENQMYINPKAYGSWVDTVNAKVYPVSIYGHAEFVTDNPQLFTKEGLTIKDFGDITYALAFHNGWVRLVHKGGAEQHNLNVQGLHGDVAKIKRLLLDIAEVEGRPNIIIDVVKPFQYDGMYTKPPQTQSHDFNLDDMKGKRELNQLLRAA